MREYLITLLISAALCYLITPFVRKFAIRFGAVADIRSRDIHTLPTPRWGGVAMWLAMTFTFLIVNNLPLVGKSFGHETQGIFLAATFVVLLGMADDRFQLDALTKLAGQALAAGILLIYGIQILWVPINGVITLPASIGQLVTVLIVLVTINAVNFIDGMDGLAAGIVAIAGIAFFAFAYLLAVDYGFSRAGAPSLTTAVLIGVCIGFLPHNAHPAKIFMGDSGSMFLGLLLAAASITLTGQIDPNAISAEKLGPTLLPLLLPLAVLAIPLADLVLAVLRRLKAGKSPFAPDKEHLHHRLMSAGNSQLKTAIIMYFWTATIAFPVTVSAFAPLWVAALTAAVLIAIT
jgi:UDP-GlcNAc:undecaprenyl-phosphate GlcNAc-1-phosphate transferase